MMAVVEDNHANDPQMEVEFKEERDHLLCAIENLNERERLIVTKHYFEGMTFESISHILGVSKQRISQMHARAVRRMREYLGRMTITDEAIKDFTCDENLLIPPSLRSLNK